MDVSLTDDEIRRVQRAAEEATAAAWHIANRTRRDPTKTQAETDLIALLGEYAFAKACGLGLEACGMSRNGEAMDGGHDVTMPDGRAAQIKTIAVKSNPNYPFLWTLEGTDTREFTADVGVLALLLPGRRAVRLAGWIPRDEFMAKRFVADLGTGERAAVRASQMRPVAVLVASVAAAARNADGDPSRRKNAPDAKKVDQVPASPGVSSLRGTR